MSLEEVKEKEVSPIEVPDDQHIILVPYRPEHNTSNQEIPQEILCPPTQENNSAPLLANKKQSILVYSKIAKWLALLETLGLLPYLAAHLWPALVLVIGTPVGVWAGWGVSKCCALLYVLFLFIQIAVRVITAALVSHLWFAASQIVAGVYDLFLLMVFIRFYRLIRLLSVQNLNELFNQVPNGNSQI